VLAIRLWGTVMMFVVVMLVFYLFALQTVFSATIAFHTMLMLDAFSVWAGVLIVIHLAVCFVIFL
jgi:hypothetical protein